MQYLLSTNWNNFLATNIFKCLSHISSRLWKLKLNANWITDDSTLVPTSVNCPHIVNCQNKQATYSTNSLLKYQHITTVSGSNEMKYTTTCHDLVSARSSNILQFQFNCIEAFCIQIF